MLSVVKQSLAPLFSRIQSSPFWRLCAGAGFYVNATVPKWKKWRMYDYVTSELPDLLSHFPSLDTSRASIMGHSMGGHGALTLFLKNPGKYKVHPQQSLLLIS